MSKDIWEKRVPEELLERTIFIGPDERIGDSSLMIETLQSTDDGVAFLIEIDGRKRFTMQATSMTGAG